MPWNELLGHAGALQPCFGTLATPGHGDKASGHPTRILLSLPEGTKPKPAGDVAVGHQGCCALTCSCEGLFLTSPWMDLPVGTLKTRKKSQFVLCWSNSRCWLFSPRCCSLAAGGAVLLQGWNCHAHPGNWSAAVPPGHTSLSLGGEAAGMSYSLQMLLEAGDC